MIVIFAGPTIAHEEVTNIIECRCLPPIAHGDILRLDLETVTAIGIIDGYFEGAPSVWHKEILYAMSQGVHVYGAASMGALRAAELNIFGMQGVGKIFEWYRDLVIEDDDEVAVSHGPVESGYMTASEPMVNIRKSLGLALEKELLDEDQFSVLIERAKSAFYKQRNWESLLSGAQWSALLDWLKTNRVNLKKEDATAMLKKMAANRDRFDQPMKTDYVFEWTNVWDAAYRSIYGQAQSLDLSVSDRLVLEQLKLAPALYHEIEQRVLSSWLVNNPGKVEPGSGAQEALKVFRAKNNLMTRAALLDHMHKVGWDETELTSQMETEGSVIIAKKLAGDLSQEIISALHQDNKYAELLEFGEKKQETMRLARVSISSSNVKRGSYLVWYFERILGVEVPYDITEYAFANGFTDIAEFDQTVMKEYLYQGHLEKH